MQKSTVINGSQIVPVALDNGEAYRLNSINNIQEFHVENIIANEIKLVDFSRVLLDDYKIIGISIALAENVLSQEDFTSMAAAHGGIKVVFRITRESSGIRLMEGNVYRGFVDIRTCLLHNDEIWEVVSTTNINRLIFYVEPTVNYLPLTIPT